MTPVIDLVSRLLESGNRPGALDLLATLRRHFPSEPTPYQQAAALLRAAQDDAALDALLADARRQLTDDPWPLIESATLAQARGQWQIAFDHAAQSLGRFPDHPPGYRLATYALRQLGRLDECDALLETCREAFSALSWPLAEWSWVAQNRRDWREAARRAELTRAAFPAERAGYMVGNQALREFSRFDDALALLRSARSLFGNEAWVDKDEAWLELARPDLARAAALAADLRNRRPNDRAGYVIGGQAYRRLKQVPEADAVYREAMARFPGDTWPLVDPPQPKLAGRDPQGAAGYATAVKAAREAGNLAQARQIAEDWRAALPRDQEPWLTLVELARRAGETRAADDLLSAAVVEFPDHAQLALRHALAPSAPGMPSARNIPEAHDRFQRLHQRFTTFIDGYEAHVAMLRENHRPHDATAVLREALMRFPDHAGLVIEQARIAEQIGDFESAIRLFLDARNRFADRVEAHVGVASAFCAAGRPDEAELASTAALKVFPKHISAWRMHATVAEARNDLHEAATRWRKAAARFPGDCDIGNALFRAQQAISDSDGIVGPSVVEAPRQLAAAERMTLSSVADRFESLGGTQQGCEFGFVQRHANVEPLGLLRWAHLPYEGLAAMLEQRLAGIGSAEQTELGYYSGGEAGNLEYKITDKRYHFVMHTFVKQSEHDFDKMYSLSCRRLKFLARKLLEDLQSDAKIFVFKIAERNLTDAELDRLRTSMRYYGDNSLLYVRYADSESPPGSVIEREPGLLVGFIDQFSVRPGGGPRTPSMRYWSEICVGAYRIWANRRARAEPVGNS
jgi:tetratricopeptide (TPR) repeat protein